MPKSQDFDKEEIVQQVFIQSSGYRNDSGEYIQDIHRTHIMFEKDGKISSVCGNFSGRPAKIKRNKEFLDCLKEAENENFDYCESCEKKKGFKKYKKKFR